MKIKKNKWVNRRIVHAVYGQNSNTGVNMLQAENGVNIQKALLQQKVNLGFEILITSQFVYI